jgi:hypothetical protein
MQKTRLKRRTSSVHTSARAFVLALSLAALPALAQPGNGHGNPHAAGNGKGSASANHGKGHGQPGGQGGNNHGPNSSGYAADQGASLAISLHFNDQQRSYLHDYYRREFGMGHCPPGLAKKNNGCLPPGQAKKWRIGYPLGSDVVFYSLPAAVLAELGPAPRGYRYARVANDILMLAIGTGLVVDAVASLGE